MNKLKQYGLQTVSNLALGFAVGSLSKTSCAFFHQPKMSQSLKKQLKEKKSNM